ncbi:hypothetical protein J6590_053173 [Homalodisca vitripennis]|nr:hypothetical protein J6590_053173 [Homalodisca vitripennis]
MAVPRSRPRSRPAPPPPITVSRASSRHHGKCEGQHVPCITVCCVVDAAPFHPVTQAGRSRSPLLHFHDLLQHNPAWILGSRARHFLYFRFLGREKVLVEVKRLQDCQPKQVQFLLKLYIILLLTSSFRVIPPTTASGQTTARHGHSLDLRHWPEAEARGCGLWWSKDSLPPLDAMTSTSVGNVFGRNNYPLPLTTTLRLPHLRFEKAKK